MAKENQIDVVDLHGKKVGTFELAEEVCANEMVATDRKNPANRIVGLMKSPGSPSLGIGRIPNGRFNVCATYLSPWSVAFR